MPGRPPRSKRPSASRRGTILRGVVLAVLAVAAMGAVLAVWQMGEADGNGTIGTSALKPSTEPVRPVTERPVTPERHAEFDATPEHDTPALTAVRFAGRAVERNGNVLADAVLRARLDGRGGLGTVVPTDTNGRFVWKLMGGAPPGTPADFSTLRGNNELVAHIRLPDAGGHELGDVVFDPPPLLISGRVVDPEGRPVAPVTLAVHHSDEPSIAQLRAPADERGMFELRGTVPRGELVLTAQHPDRPTVKHTFAAGARDVVLVMPRGSFYEGQLQLAPATLSRRLHLVVRGPLHRDTVTVSIDARGRFRFQVPWTGRSSLELGGIGWIGDPLVLFDDLHLTPDAEADERLEYIDLGGRVTVTRLLVDDADGKRVSSLLARDLSGSGRSTNSTAYGAGEHLLVHTGPPREASISTRGSRETVVQLRGGSETVVLRRGLPVALALADGKKLPTGVDLTVELRPAGVDGEPLVGHLASGSVQFELRAPGTWIGSIHVQSTRRTEVESEERKPQTSTRSQEFVVDVADMPQLQRFTITLDSATLQRAAQLGRD